MLGEQRAGWLSPPLTSKPAKGQVTAEENLGENPWEVCRFVLRHFALRPVPFCGTPSCPVGRADCGPFLYNPTALGGQGRSQHLWPPRAYASCGATTGTGPPRHPGHKVELGSGQVERPAVSPRCRGAAEGPQLGSCCVPRASGTGRARRQRSHSPGWGTARTRQASQGADGQRRPRGHAQKVGAGGRHHLTEDERQRGQVAVCGEHSRRGCSWQRPRGVAGEFTPRGQRQSRGW